ncbi:hypothetical protein K438DRAFT_1980398 [Mycena galopus ATCC 62051]|nr:hypothetical protein K438DRAFT_1980398 [Mycena galopus ATCC 62051]
MALSMWRTNCRLVLFYTRSIRDLRRARDGWRPVAPGNNLGQVLEICFKADELFQYTNVERTSVGRQSLEPGRQKPFVSSKNPPAKQRMIYVGTPSSIKQDLPGKGFRYPLGKRTRRRTPLARSDLYLTEARPPQTVTATQGHKCMLCDRVKAHPVRLTKCGHSFCYVCIRLRLEREWTCPQIDCNRTIRNALMIDAMEAESVRSDYPNLVDESEVSAKGRGRRGGAPPAPPRMHAHQPHSAAVFSVSSNGRSVATHSHTVVAHVSVPEYAQEDIMTNAAVESWNFSYDLGDTSLLGEVQEPETDGITLKKRKVYENSDNPMLTWGEFQDEYLDEMLRLEGRGYSAMYSTCYGPSLFCQGCIVERHAVLPTHWIEEWNQTFFERCASPLKANKGFVVIDITGTHNVNVNFCKCDGNIEKRQQLMRVRWWPATARDPQTCATFGVVRLFQILNCLGKVSSHDFLRSLELLTNNNGLNPPPDRRRAFRHIVRQWRTTLMMKRAGRGHALSGVKGTSQGELVLQCRACPQDGRNLPDGWDKICWGGVPEDLRYKYFLFLAQDCNFRLVNRSISSVAKDPIIGDGFGCFVNHAKYTEYLRVHVTEEEISTCSGFQAMFLANKKRVKGLRTTGVGGVTCAHHNMWRPNGIRDLQLGERHCNVDFILLSALLNVILFYLILSYDIACQYGKKFWTRMEGFPELMRLLINPLWVWFKVPNFHLPPHIPACHSPFSFHYMWGAESTKMMGMGMRHATLEDIFGFHNWRRLVAWRGLFAKRMALNVKEGQVHRDVFDAFDAALQQTAPELVTKWKAWVHEWESKQHTDGILSPFELKEKVMSMCEIKLKLAKEELLKSGEGTEVEREDTLSTFILMGMEIEESRYLAINVKAVANPTDTQTVDFLKRRHTLVKRLRAFRLRAYYWAFRKLQRTYMPNVRKFLSESQRATWDSEADRDAEGVRLLMPSDILDKKNRLDACAIGLPSVEAELRIGEAREALQALRQALWVRTMTNRFKLRHCTGQQMLTRGQGVLRQLNVKVHKAKLRYRYARNAVMRLKGTGSWEMELRVLEDDDIRALNERALTKEEVEQRKKLLDYGDITEEGGVASLGAVAHGEGRCTLSWIWYTAKEGEAATEKELVEALCVEWCKAYARMRCWHEDIVLVEEEMRQRTIAYGYYAAAEWVARTAARADMVDKELLEGLTAYAREQEEHEKVTCTNLTGKWDRVRQRGRAYLARETAVGLEVVVPVDEDDPREQQDDEEGPSEYEDEDDEEVEE